MGQNLWTGVRITFACLAAAAWQLGDHPAAWAQQAPAPVAPAPAAPAPAAPAAPASNAMTTPSMAGPLVANPNPLNFNAGPLGAVYFNGAISGLGLVQSAPESFIDHNTTGAIDFSNGLFSLQNTSGIFQFFAQAGVYSFPTVGAPYFHAGKTVGDFFGPAPVAYAKLVPSDAFSLQVGKLPTLIGAEYGFTFQNMNIERGLLWGQEPIVSRGIQGNYTQGPLAFSMSLNDGFYSGNYNWLSGSATWTIDKINTLEVVAGGNFGHTSLNTTASPVFFNNSTIVNLIYTYSNAPWTITPYFQYTSVPAGAVPGSPGASTYGGAVLATYAISDTINLSGRFEAIGSSGGATAPNLLYGPASGAISLTLTPTWQSGIFFARADASYVQAFSTTAGDVFGSSGSTNSQFRFVLEGGIVF